MSYDYTPKDGDESKTVNDFVQVAEVKVTGNMSCISHQTSHTHNIYNSLQVLRMLLHTKFTTKPPQSLILYIQLVCHSGTEIHH